MTDILLTFHCAMSDADVVAAAIRQVSDAPIHGRRELVRGQDFSDADTEEQVMGKLKRAAFQLVIAETERDAIIAAVAKAQRQLPVRWLVMPVIAHGRLA